ncbi:PREDICTED: ethylene-insensitive protein 2 [Fragaria vesca subsp. vesca]|uniref:ethylene-insensitive protein 2 n=1 Tax=Fragaria vesca subsp. vesca TaxID=101020 RepID=UPI0002C30FCB|nr:PREDICTED: ethylene-insensitive protein 2 [Fragaria vesca subsp. vesca]
MESASCIANNRPGAVHQLLPVVGPMLLIAVGYLDPGKWAATVEAGSRYGTDLAAVMFIFNLAAILCHYLSARIAVVTGRDLAQICSEEYDKATCIFLGVQTEMSVILLDLTMILGIAHGLNLLFGWDLFTCVFLTAANAVLYPLFSTLLDTCKAKFLCVCIYVAGFILLSFVLGVFISQPQMPLSMTGMLTKLSGESAFSLIESSWTDFGDGHFSQLSFILILQQHQQQQTVSKDTLCQNHFVAIFCMFNGIYLVNYVLMTLAANAFYTSRGLLTFQDAMSLIEQVFWGPIVPVAFLLVLFLSNQITTLSWSLGGQVVLNDFLKLDLPGWLHCATIRIIAVVPALYFVWSSGAEGMYQLLVSTQVLAALLLPSSVIPLFRVAASRQLMGAHKISQFVEFSALITLIGMLGLKVVFVVEMIFGNSDWVDNLRWDAGSSMSVLLITASASFCLMIWLAATPLKSASARIENQVWNWDMPKGVSEPFRNKETDIAEHNYHRDADIQKHEPSPSSGDALDRELDTAVANFDFVLPETLLEPDQELQLSGVEENSSLGTFPHSAKCSKEEPTPVVELTRVPTVANEVSDVTVLGTDTVKFESTEQVEKTLATEGDLPTEKDDDEGDTWEPEDSLKEASESTTLTSEGPGSFRSLSAKGDEGGSGAGSLSRLAGLGRAARRQLAAALDEFWGQLYDFHGNVIKEARTKKLDLLLGSDSKASSAASSASSLLKDDTTAKEVSGCFPSVGGKGSDPLINLSLYDSVNQQRLQNSIESAYGAQRGSSLLWPGHMHLLDAYVQNSSRSVIDLGERRYSSVHSIPSSDLGERRYSSVRSIPSSDLGERRYSSVRSIPTSDLGERRYSSVRSIPSAESWDYQPATVHGYQMPSYLNRNDRSSSNLNGQIESPALNSASSLGAGNYRDSLAFTMGQKLQNGLGSVQASSFQNLTVSRQSPLQSDRPYYDVPSSGISENAVNSANAKKYHSLPDINRDLYNSSKSAPRDPPPGFGIMGYESSLYPKSGVRGGGSLAFDEVSPSNVYKDVRSSQPNSNYGTGSLWSRQPFEQFGVADNNRSIGTAVGSRAGSAGMEATSVADSEAKLLQSFRHCIVKLLKLEGSDWLFRQNDGVDEDLIDRVAAREKILYDAETREINRTVHMGESPYPSSDRKSASAKMNDVNLTHLMVSSVPNCGEGCIWRSDLIISFGVWCIHRILDLSLMESRPELWGKYTYVLNRLQGIIDAAFSKPRTPMSPCFCLQIAAAQQQKSSPTFSNGMLPPAAKPARGKCTTAVTLLDIIKDVEIAISCRKGRTGTAAGDVAFPKGKENLASVLKRYKRRLSNKPVGTNEGPSGSRKGTATSAPYAS